MEKILNLVLSSIDHQVLNSNSTINSDFTQAPTVNFPEIHLRSILQNLVTNAIKYRKQETPLIITINTKYDPLSDKVMLFFADNGRGIDLEKYGNKVFELFQRFHLDIDGKGMGLYIIKLIVESYGGEIAIRSEPDTGTEFEMTL